MEVKQFLEVDEDLLCSICHNVMVSPHSCNQGHAFCFECISRWMQTATTCPVGRCPISNSTLTKLLVVQNMISRLTVRCPNASVLSSESCRVPSGPRRGSPQNEIIRRETFAGCEWQGKLCEQEAHLKECSHAYVECTNPGCSIRVQRLRVADHEASCDFRLIPCEHCNEPVAAGSLAAHFDICKSVLIDCPVGCGVRISRGQYEEHSRTCLNAPVVCPFECHGCTAQLQRRELAAHLSDAGAKHAELVSQQVQTLKMQVLALSDRLKEQETPFKRSLVWRLLNVSEKFQKRHNLASNVFRVSTVDGVYHMKLWLEFNGEHIGLFIMHHVDDSGCSMLPIAIGGSCVTVEGVVAPSESNLYAAGDVISEAGRGLGRAHFLPISRVLSDFVADDVLTIRASLRISCIAELQI